MAASSQGNLEPPAIWVDLYKRQGQVLAFHGCDRSTGEAVLAGKKDLDPSKNDHDWLGQGIYFWEADPWRALAFATEAKSKTYLTNRPITNPYVVGAIIDLGLCCNLLEIHALKELREAHDELMEVFKLVGLDAPKNVGADLAKRNLDKAVVDYMHMLREKRGVKVNRKRVPLPPYDTVRAAFPEGTELYPGAGFRSKNHIQIAVRNRNCIKGYFRLPGL
jgi:hypothetical protein